MTKEYSQEFQGTPNSFASARESLSRYLHAHATLNKNQIVDIGIAIGEVIQNIVRYGYKGGDPNKIYKMWVASTHPFVRVQIKDFASPIRDLSFLSKRHLPSELGNMGINLINKIASEYTINPQNDGNLHTLVFATA